MSKLLNRLLRKHDQTTIRRFLQEAYLDHEITPQDYQFLLDKLGR
jgi:hypothetical protein